MFVNGGRDFIAAQVYTNTSAGTRGAGGLALTENATAPAATDTVLTAEITTNGLQRVDATDKTHSAGTNVTTIHHAFTASGAFSAVQKLGLFNNAVSGGTLVNEKAFSPTALNSGDIIDVTITITGPSTGT